MSIPKGILEQNKCLGDWAILVGYRGSISHGMYVKNDNPNSIDDKDVMSVCVPPIDWYFGIHAAFAGNKNFPTNGTHEIKQDEWDIVAYESRKFISLLAQGNPNVLSMLWLNPKYYIKIAPAGQLILDNRQLFVGRHVYKSFTGYAYSQLHRMTHFLSDEDAKKYEQELREIESKINLEISKGLEENQTLNKLLSEKADLENLLATRTRYATGYMGKKRKALVDKFGMDTKNAAHLIRLLRMGIEFLKDGELYVEREDAPQLLDIKLGKWTLEQVKEESSRLFKLAEEAYVASALPKSPALDKISELSVEVARMALGI